MKLFDMIKNFKSDESGAVTVDWVVLTAAIVGLGVAVLAAVGSSTENLATAIGTQIDASQTFDTTPDGS